MTTTRSGAVVGVLGSSPKGPWIETTLRYWLTRCSRQKRQRGGIEPLHVPMPRELKSRPSPSH